MLSMLLAIVMVVGMLPGFTLSASADDTTHTHCVCGKNDCSGDGHDATQEWTAWTETSSLPKTKGYYYLTDDVTLSTTWDVKADIKLCLNGRNITMVETNTNKRVINISGSGYVLTLTDCQTNMGKISGGRAPASGGGQTKGYGSGVYIANGGKFVMYGGIITGNYSTAATLCYGNGVAVGGSTSAFIMYGGEISGNSSSNKKTYGGGVYTAGNFTMYGGKISNNTSSVTDSEGGGVCVYGTYGGTFEMNDGEISGNSAYYGGGVSVHTGTFTLNGGTIKENKSTKNGGGIYIWSSATFTMNGGTVSGNTATSSGGGIYSGSPKATIKGGTISGNSAPYGGGVYVILPSNGTTDALKLSGKFVINNNSNGNIYISSYKKLVIAGDLDASVSIGITTGSTPTATSPVTITTANSKDYSKHFYSENSSYYIYNDNNTVKLITTPTYLVTVNDGDGGGFSKEGETVTLSKSGYKITNANVTSGGVTLSVSTDQTTATFTMPAQAVSVEVTYEKIAVTGVSVASTLAMNVGDTETLTANVLPDGAVAETIAWSSDNTDVATVDENGKVTAVSDGTTTITVTAEGHTATCTVTVHAHRWGYDVTTTNAEKDTIEATCNTEGCTSPDGGSVTISATGGVYKRAAYKATLSATTVGGKTVSASNIVYYKQNGTDWEKLTTAPTDVGTYKASITVTADGTDYTASVEYAISKGTQSAPAAPTMASYTDVSITLTAQDGCVYSKDGTNWQESPTFTGLTANTEYTFYAKLVATDNYNESAASKGAKISTDKIAITSVSPAVTAPVKLNTPDTAVTVESGANYTASTITWAPTATTFLGATAYTATFTLTPGDNYKFTDATEVTVTGAVVTKTLNSDGTLTVKAAFAETAARATASIAVKTAPTDTEYTYGDTFAPAGLVITVTYDDGTTADVTYSESNQNDFSFSSALNVATTAVIVTYGGKTAEIPVTVEKQSVIAPENAGSKVFTGETLSADVDVTDKPYTVTTNAGGINVGNYDVVLTLTDPANYKWSDSEDATKTITFAITPATALHLDTTATMVKNHANYTDEIDLTEVSGYPQNPGAVPTFTVTSGTYNGLTSVTVDASGVLTLVADKTTNDTADTVVVNVTGMLNYADTTTITVAVSYTDKVPVEISGITAADAVYSGTAQLGYSGTPTSAYDGEYVFTYVGTGDTVYGPTADAPTEVGSYSVTISVPESSAQYSGSTTINFTIEQAEPTVGTLPTASSIKRSLALSKSTLSGGVMLGADGNALAGTFAWKAPNTVMNASGNMTAIVVFTPEDTVNYEAVELTVTVRVYTPNTDDGIYTVNFKTNGAAIIQSQQVEKNGKAEKPADPEKEGYIFGGWYTDYACTDKFSFSTKITSSITLYAKWTKATETSSKWDGGFDDCPKDETCPIDAFTDANAKAWYHDGVHFCLDNGLMVGYPDDLFMPDAGTTRAMLVTMLWRFEGAPVVNYLMMFDDVEQDAWYAEAVRWAASEGIVLGYDDTTFAPDDSITREQMAALLYRYIQKNGGGFTGMWMFLLDYTDRAEVSEWAYESVCYMTMHSLMQGKNDKVFDPQGSATRAEVATLFRRYCVNLEK